MNNKTKNQVITKSKPKVSFWQRVNVRLSEKEKVMFVKYLSVLLESGLSLDDSLDVLLSQSSGPLKKILDKIITEVRSGKTLASGLANFSYIFSDVFTNLIEAGENSGTLQKNLAYLANQTQKQYDLKQSIKGSMMYPLIVMIGGIGVSIFIIVFIFPNIISLFQTLNVELPFTTRVLLWVANLMTQKPFLVIGTIFGFIFLLSVAVRIRTTKFIIHKLILKIPVIGKILKDSVLSGVFRLLGTLIESGMPLKQSITITKSTVNNLAFKKMFDELETKVTQGGELVTVLRNYDHLVPMMSVRLIHVGAQTGQLENMLLYLADFYNKEVDELSKRISIIIEPVLIITIGIMIGFLAFAVISPIYQVITNIS